jgi:DDE_Tnp_1-associated
MSVSHAAVSTVTSADEEPSDELPGLLQVLAQVPDPRRRRGKRYLLVFVLAVAVACTLAGARNFRHAGLTTTQRKPPRPVGLTLTNRASWRTQLHAYSEHRIRRYAPGATPILSCQCPLYNRR